MKTRRLSIKVREITLKVSGGYESFGPELMFSLLDIDLAVRRETLFISSNGVYVAQRYRSCIQEEENKQQRIEIYDINNRNKSEEESYLVKFAYNRNGSCDYIFGGWAYIICKIYKIDNSSQITFTKEKIDKHVANMNKKL